MIIGLSSFNLLIAFAAALDRMTPIFCFSFSLIMLLLFLFYFIIFTFSRVVHNYIELYNLNICDSPTHFHHS